MTNHPNRNAKNYDKAAADLEARLCAQYPALAKRKVDGLIVVARERGTFYVHHDNGVGRNTYAEVLEAIAADKIVLTVANGVRPA